MTTTFRGTEKLRTLRDWPRLRRALVGTGFLVLFAVASVSIFATAPDVSPEAPQERAWPVSVQVVEPGPLSPRFSSYGRVESSRQSRIRTDLVAEIVDVPVREGQWVEAGDVLVELRRDDLALEVREHAAELDQERAQLESIRTAFALMKQSGEHFEALNRVAQAKLARHQDLLKKRMISRALLDEVVQQSSAASIEYQRHLRELADFPNKLAAQRARVVMAETRHAQAQLELQHATITAPFSGPVISVTASPGDYSVIGAPLVELADAAGFEVRAPIPDSYRARVRRYLADGLPVTATASIDNAPTEFSLVRFASNVRSGHSGSDAFFRIDIESDAPLPEVGRVLDLTITLPPEPNVVALPVQSIYENDRIYRVDRDRLQSMTVERLGDHRSADGEYRVLVRSGDLVAGQTILTTQLPKAISGLKVAPIATAGG